jgi:hypothetical protein
VKNELRSIIGVIARRIIALEMQRMHRSVPPATSATASAVLGNERNGRCCRSSAHESALDRSAIAMAPSAVQRSASRFRLFDRCDAQSARSTSHWEAVMFDERRLEEVGLAVALQPDGGDLPAPASRRVSCRMEFGDPRHAVHPHSPRSPLFVPVSLILLAVLQGRHAAQPLPCGSAVYGHAHRYPLGFLFRRL